MGTDSAMLNDQTALAMIVDFGASHTIVGVYDKNQDLILLNTEFIQSGMMPTILYLHADLSIDLNSQNSVYVFDDLKNAYLNQKTYYLDVFLRKQACNSKDEANNIYNNDLKKFVNDNSIDLKDYDLTKSLFYEFKDNTYYLKLILKIHIDDLIKFFFKRLKQQIFIKTRQYVNAIIYATPAYLSNELNKKLEVLLTQCDLFPLLHLTEPEASLLCYDDILANHQKYMVIDSGASTTDLCIVSKEDYNLIVSAIRGNNNCGGSLIDWEIIRFWLNKYGSLPNNLHQAILSAKMYLNDPKNKMADFYYYEEDHSDDYTHIVGYSSLKLDENKKNELIKLESTSTAYNNIHELNTLLQEIANDYNQALIKAKLKPDSELDIKTKKEVTQTQETKQASNSATILQKGKSVYNPNKIFLNFNEINKNLNPLYTKTPKKYLNYKQVYKLTYYEYLMCASTFFERYLALINDFDGIYISGIVLSGGSNLNLFISNYFAKQKEIPVLKNHIFDSIINGLYTAYNKRREGKLNLIHNNPIDVVCTCNNEQTVLITNNAILPAHYEYTISNLKTDFNLYLGVGINESKKIDLKEKDQVLSYLLTPTLKYEDLLAAEQDSIPDTYNEDDENIAPENINIDLHVVIDISTDYEFKVRLFTNHVQFEPLVINQFKFSNFNLIYLQLAQETINIFNYIKNIDPKYTNENYVVAINDINSKKQYAERWLAKQDFTKYRDDTIIEKVEGKNGLYSQFQEYDLQYQELQKNLNQTSDVYSKRSLYEFFMNTSYNQLKTSLQFFYQLQAIISGKNAPFN